MSFISIDFLNCSSEVVYQDGIFLPKFLRGADSHYNSQDKQSHIAGKCEQTHVLVSAQGPALKMRLKVVSTGVEQLLQLFIASTPNESLLVLASALDTKKQAPRAEKLTQEQKGQAAAVSPPEGQRPHLRAAARPGAQPTFLEAARSRGRRGWAGAPKSRGPGTVWAGEQGQPASGQLLSCSSIPRLVLPSNLAQGGRVAPGPGGGGPPP